MSQEAPARAPDPERRGVLIGLTWLLLCIPLLGPFLLALRVALGSARRQGPQRIPTLPLADIPRDSVRPFTLRYVRRVGAFREEVGQQVFLRRQGDQVLALSSQCTHLGCPVRFERPTSKNGRSEALLHCPCHRGSFDLEGRVISGPPPRDLDRFSTEVPEDVTQPVLVLLGGSDQ